MWHMLSRASTFIEVNAWCIEKARETTLYETIRLDRDSRTYGGCNEDDKK